MGLILIFVQTLEINLDFRNGYTDAGLGIDMYVTPSGELRNVGNDWDLNDDGWLDIVLTVEKGDASYILYRGALGFGLLVDTLKVLEREAGAIADFNNDGFEDILLIPGIKNDYSYIFYGSNKRFVKKDSFRSPANHGSVSVADLNNDGYLDIVYSTWYYENKNSLIYWGSEEGFSISNSTEIPVKNAHGNAIADFNKDGYPDILIGKYFSCTDTGKTTFTYSYLFYGSGNGFDWTRRDSFITVGVGDDISVADIDKNGWLDIVFPNHSSLPPPRWSGYTFSYIYYNYGGFFKKDSLFTIASWSSSVADVDNNGLLDIVFSNCPFDDTLPKGYSYIYYQLSPGKFKRDSFNTRGGSTVMIADFDNNGYKDIVFGNEDYRNIYIYYNFFNGFFKKEKFSCGQVDACITQDLGNIYDRTGKFTYYSETLHPFDSGICILKKIEWEMDTLWHGRTFPQNVILDSKVFIRTKMEEDEEWMEWVEISNGASYILPFSYLQIKIVISTNFFAGFSFKKMTIYFDTLSTFEEKMKYSLFEVNNFGTGKIELKIYSLSEEEVPARMYNCNGRVVAHFNLKKGVNTYEVKLPGGIYFIKIGEKWREKFLVIK